MLCRLCLYEVKQNSVPLGEESHLTKLIAKYMHVEVSERETFSTKLCKDCYEHLNDFHNFFQYVERRQNELQNEFLEVNCVIAESAGEFLNVNKNVEHNEESLLDMKDIIAVGETSFEKLLPQSEFGFAADDDDDDQNGLEETYSFDDDDEDDLPLQALLTKDSALNNSTRVENGEIEEVQRRKSKRVGGTITRRAKSKTRRKQTRKTINERNIVNDETSTNKSKSLNSEENKQRDEIISKYMQLKCEICSKSVQTFKQLRFHFRREHKAPAYVTCCGTRFHRRFVLVDHIQVHLNPDKFRCKLCNKVLKSKICMDIHYANKHADKSELKHPCTLCERRFAHLSNLAAHMMSHTDERKHHCDICKKAFKSNYMLKVHIRAMHEQRTTFICDTCGKEYKFKPSFERHVAEHQGQPNEPTEQCKICGKWLMPNGLRRHMDRHNLKDVECKFCGKILKSKAALTGHIEYSHKKKQIYSCNLCDKTFKRPCVLKEHIAMHTGQKDYNCSHCGREFRSKANMYAHIKKTHVEEWAEAQLNRNKGPSAQMEKMNELNTLTAD